MSFILEKTKRIRNKRCFDSFFSSARYFQLPHFRIYYSPRAKQHSSVAFIAGKRTGNAVLRNLAKRRLREFYRLHQHSFNLDYDFVFVAHHQICKVTSKQTWQSAIKQLKIAQKIQSPIIFDTQNA